MNASFVLTLFTTFLIFGHVSTRPLDTHNLSHSHDDQIISKDETHHKITLLASQGQNQIIKVAANGDTKSVNGGEAEAGVFSIKHGENCVYKVSKIMASNFNKKKLQEGNIIENGVSRKPTTAEETKIIEFKSNMKTFSAEMKKKMVDHMVALLKKGMKKVENAEDKWPMAPTPPCLCANCAGR